MSIYGFNEGYNLSAAPLSSFRTPSRSKVVKSEALYTPPIINLNPLTPAQSLESITVGARSYALQRMPENLGAGFGAQTMCSNAPQVANLGASLCMNPQTRACSAPPVPSQCPKGHVAINQFSGTSQTEPTGVTYGMMTY